MDLADYDALNLTELATRTGLSVPTLCRIRSRERTAGLKTALSIEEATDGAVRAEDLPITERTREMIGRLKRAERGNGG